MSAKKSKNGFNITKGGTVVTQQTQARATFDLERHVVESTHGLAEAEKPSGVGFSQIGYGNEIVVTRYSGLESTQLRKPVEHIQKEQGVVSVAVCGRHNMIAVPSHGKKQQRICCKPNERFG